MLNRLTRALSMTAVCLLLLSVDAYGEDRWHQASLHFTLGGVARVAELDGKDTYRALDMGSGKEMGLGYTLVVNRQTDLAFLLTQSSASGTQYNRPGSGNENNTLHTHLKLTRLYITGKYREPDWGNIFVPWWGGGCHIGMIKTREQERFLMPGGALTGNTLHEKSMTMGAHVSAGMDIYPYRQSSLAITLETRYSLEASNGPFNGSTGGLAVWAGIRWDFWPISE